MSININQGPERVEVNLRPVGRTLIPGASTARTAMLVATKKADAPLNTPTLVFSPQEFEALFGTETDMGEAYLSMQGFYDNAGVGAELLVVAVEPSGVSSEVFESALSAAPRSIVGSFGSLLDSGALVTGIELVSYDAATGAVTFDASGATGDYGKVKKGDFLRDAQGRLFQIKSLQSGSEFKIQAGLDIQQQKTSQSIASIGSDFDIIRLFPEGKLAGKMFVQEGAVYGASVAVTVSGTLLTISGFDTTLNDVRVGDIIKDSADKKYLVVEVVDGNNVVVDRVGMTAGVVDFIRGIKKKSIQSTKAPSSEFLSLNLFPYEAADGKVKYNLASSASNPAEGVLKDYFLTYSDGTSLKIIDNKIVAESTVISSAFAGSISYVASTGVVTATGETLQADGVLAGDVLIDSSGREFVIQEVISETEIRIKKNLSSPSSLPGARVNKGAIELDVDFDLSSKVDGQVGEDDSGSIRYAQNSFVFQASASMKSSGYFAAEPSFASSDFIGSQASLTGLRSLDGVDIVNLAAIPGIYDPAVQGALIDYCSVVRDDCMALVSIPEFITSASQDRIVAANLAIASVQESANGSIVSFLATPDLSEVSTYDILRIGSSQFIVKSVSDEDDQIVVFETTGIPTVGAVSVASPSAVTWKDVIINKPTTRAAWYYNHLLVQNAAGGSSVVDPVGHVAGVMARIDSNIGQGGVSHAPAGIQFAQIAGTQGLQLDISERLDGGPLRLAFINRITESTGNGRYVFGGYTAAGNSATADEQLIQVIRSALFIKTSLEPGLVGFLWENNSPVTRQNIENSILSFLRSNGYLFPAGLPEDQQFQVESVTPDDLALAQGLVEVTVKVRFNTAIRFISIDLSFPLPVSDQ